MENRLSNLLADIYYIIFAELSSKFNFPLLSSRHCVCSVCVCVVSKASTVFVNAYFVVLCCVV